MARWQTRRIRISLSLSLSLSLDETRLIEDNARRIDYTPFDTKENFDDLYGVEVWQRKAEKYITLTLNKFL